MGEGMIKRGKEGGAGRREGAVVHAKRVEETTQYPSLQNNIG